MARPRPKRKWKISTEQLVEALKAHYQLRNVHLESEKQMKPLRDDMIGPAFAERNITETQFELPEGDNIVTVRATYDPSPTAEQIDAEMLRVRLKAEGWTPAKFRTLCTQVLDVQKVLDAIERGDIDPVTVRESTKQVKGRSTGLRYTRRKVRPASSSKDDSDVVIVRRGTAA